MMPAKDRILNKILVHENGCWNWIGAVRKGSNQYGRLTIGSRKDGTRKSVSAHRLAYETFIGPVADGLCVCHKCDNPSCVNPKHLFLGTLKDNSDDRDAKGRNSPPPPFSSSTARKPPHSGAKNDYSLDARTLGLDGDGPT